MLYSTKYSPEKGFMGVPYMYCNSKVTYGFSTVQRKVLWKYSKVRYGKRFYGSTILNVQYSI